jgi:hypothetical protein
VRFLLSFSVVDDFLLRVLLQNACYKNNACFGEKVAIYKRMKAGQRKIQLRWQAAPELILAAKPGKK